MKYLSRVSWSFLRFCPGYPCLNCGSYNNDRLNGFCSECLKELPLVRPPRCPGCGGHLDGVLALCPKCLDIGQRPWLEALALLEHRGCAVELLARFKNGTPQLARPFGDLALPYLRAWESDVDIITAVPLHWTRRWRRSYNQSELFAREIARRWHKPYKNLLIRSERGSHQALLKRSERLKKAQKLYKIRHNSDVSGRKILLVDDILTTGATLSANAALLLQAGALEVRVLVIARR